MCGIIGCFSSQEKPIKSALEAIKHRGPDASSSVSYRIKKNCLQLGHNRLAIVDINPSSNQPFISKDGRYTLVFNGEIYNYVDLKRRLEIEGVEFHTSSDTEVLLEWLISHGIEGLDQLDGMFAFCLFDQKTSEVIISRDPLGIKPLYYHINDSEFYFCSELRGLFLLEPSLKVIDESLIAEYLLTNFISEPETGFKNIKKVKPGHSLILDLNELSCSEKKHFDINETQGLTGRRNDYNSLIAKETEAHLNSDVPLGLFYSGGVDSTILLCNTKKHDITNLIVISNDNSIKESGLLNDYHYAKKITEHLEVNLEEVKIDNALERAEKFLEAIHIVADGNEELCGDFTFYSSLMVSKKARELRLITMLSGMGADEIFAGYDRYKIVKYENFYKLFLPFLGLIKITRRYSKKADRFASYFTEKNFILKYSSLVGYFSANEVMKILGDDQGIQRYIRKTDNYLKSFSGLSKLRKAMAIDLYGYLSHNFLVADKSSMRASIELRVPLATKKLLKMAWSDAERRHINIFKTKKVLKSFLRGKIPNEAINRRKTGFNAPMDAYINALGKTRILTELDTSSIFSYLDRNETSKIISNHFYSGTNETYKLVSLLYLAAWLQLYDVTEKT